MVRSLTMCISLNTKIDFNSSTNISKANLILIILKTVDISLTYLYTHSNNENYIKQTYINNIENIKPIHLFQLLFHGTKEKKKRNFYSRFQN